MRTETRRRRPAVVLGAAAAALIAVLALAGLAIAHGGGKHHDDDDPAGQIASFDRDTGQLVIDLGDGGQIAGTVTKWTWIKDGDKCDEDDGGETSRHRRNWDCDDQDSDSGDRGYRHRVWGDGDDDDHGSGHHHGRGGIDDLVVGAVVEDSLMVLKDGSAFFAKIDLED